MAGKPEKSFKRITEALTKRFPQPLGMLDDMLNHVEGLMGKHYSKCLSDTQACQKVCKDLEQLCSMQSPQNLAATSTGLVALAP